MADSPAVRRHNTITYVELGAKNAADYAGTRTFYETAFGWQYTEYGPDYADTPSSGVGSGINGDADHRPMHPLPVVYVDDLEAAQRKVVDAGGIVTRAIFSFPGGRRFHFADPAGNELAVWSDN
jgi:predicted enzyme related to lactoylglutathione lyase